MSEFHNRLHALIVRLREEADKGFGGSDRDIAAAATKHDIADELEALLASSPARTPKE